MDSLPDVKLFAILLAALLMVPSCSTKPNRTLADGFHETHSPAMSELSQVELPPKQFTKHPDGSIEITGHWTLKVSENLNRQSGAGAPAGSTPYATRTLNSTIIRCWPSKRSCAEYRAQISYGMLFSAEPMDFQVLSWDAFGKIIAIWDMALYVHYLFHIDLASEVAEMEFRRDPGPGEGRVFERWVLE